MPQLEAVNHIDDMLAFGTINQASYDLITDFFQKYDPWIAGITWYTGVQGNTVLPKVLLTPMAQVMHKQRVRYHNEFVYKPQSLVENHTECRWYVIISKHVPYVAKTSLGDMISMADLVIRYLKYDKALVQLTKGYYCSIYKDLTIRTHS